jgi:hypothetical protein
MGAHALGGDAMKRLLRYALVCVALAPVPLCAQSSSPSFLSCLLGSAAAGLASTPLSVLGIPEANGESPVMFGLKVSQACLLNDAVGARNTQYAATLPAEVAKYVKFGHLFQQTELPIHFGDVPGTEVGLGAGQLQFISLVPAMLQNSWTRTMATSATGNTPRAEAAVTTIAGTTNFRSFFRDPSVNSASRETQAYTDGAEVAMEASLTAEENAQDLKVSADSIEAILKTLPPNSGRARQLRALALVRTALANNQRLRTEAAMLRATADVAQTGLSDTFINRVATSTSARVSP